ncbi:hypothetical protein GCM10025867_18780 [Frondihabitans sucicola]|uniref:Bacterial Ig domain-containing protein n=2 Tax=Frondihabitans sucicola TaxID=1268041 RepID=A0ABN6Y0I8_9MICO|nr:hypothetical protein GCM10025867_18780 [Frondihabitans sucicola]
MGIVGATLAVLALALAGIAGSQSPADAAASAPPAGAGAAPGSGSTNIASPTPAPPVEPTIQVANSDSARTTARGTATPGATLRILDPVHPASSLCPDFVVPADGTWSCRITVTSGAGQRLTVRDVKNTSLADVQSPTFSVLTPPVFATASGLAKGARVSGIAYPRAGVVATVTAAKTGTAVQIKAVADSTGAWQATLPASTVPSGSYVATATQSSAAIPDVPVSSASSAISITIDREAPRPRASSTPSPTPRCRRSLSSSTARAKRATPSPPTSTAIRSAPPSSTTAAGVARRPVSSFRPAPAPCRQLSAIPPATTGPRPPARR